MSYLEAIDRLPEADNPVEVLITIQILLRNLGIELADRYDKTLKNEIGPDWFEALQNLRQTKITIIDPQFVLSEPLRYSDSPTRKCLPHGKEFYDKLQAALEVRNSWAHHEYSELTLNSLYPSVVILLDFSKAAGMALAQRCKAVKNRIVEIQNGTYKSQSASPSPTLLSQLDQMTLALEEARLREAKANEDIAAAHELLEQAAKSGKSNEHGIEATAQTNLEEALANALEEKAQLEYLVESLAAAANAQSSEIESDQIGAGHVWQGPIPTRRVKLVSLKNDFYDDKSNKFVGEEYGPDSNFAIQKMRPLLPANSTIYLSESGHVVTYINGDPIFVGSLSNSSSQGSSEITGFFTPHNYVLRINGDIENKATGETLEDVIGDSARATGSDLILLRPNGGILRITTDGLIASQVRGSWVALRQVPPDSWFPGHL